MSTGTSKRRASSKTVSMWRCVSSHVRSLYGQPPTTLAPIRSASSISSCVPGALTMPSCGKATTSRSRSSRYSSRTVRAVSTPSRPWIGSTSGCARIAIVPFATSMSSTARERSRTSSRSCSALSWAVRRIASASVPSRAGWRREISALSRCRSGSTNPGSTARPPASIVRAASASMRSSIAAIRSPSIAMSTGGRSSQTRAFVMSRSIRFLFSLGRSSWPAAAWREHGAGRASCHWHGVTADALASCQEVTMTVVRGGRTVRPMPVACLVRPGAYFDSVVLMQIAAELRGRPGVRNASLGMGTPANKEVLAAAGLLAPDAGAAGPNDLIVALDADEGGTEDALAAAEAALEARTAPPAAAAGAEPRRPRTLAEAPAGLAIVSTPGRYAGAEALKALRLGMNVFCFSDNVALEQEIELKREAHARGLIVMGPDCGTAMVAGVPLGFVNEVRAGDIGLIGASGTGLQQISTLVDRWGAGVSHMVGVGSHDLAAEVGAVSMLDALDALAADPATKVIGLVSKPPDPEVAERVLTRAAASGKPVVAAFLGADPEGAPDGVTMAATLEEAPRALVRASTGSEPAALDGDRAGSARDGGRRL